MSDPLLALCGSGKMQSIRDLVAKVAAANATVLLRGGSGVGKEVVARALHKASTRAARPFLKVNCAALPSELLESELFGHEKGAFTGAYRQKPGKFEAAHQGTLLLDEIGEMPPAGPLARRSGWRSRRCSIGSTGIARRRRASCRSVKGAALQDRAVRPCRSRHREDKPREVMAGVLP